MSRKAERLALALSAEIASRIGVTKSGEGSLFGALLPVCEVVIRQDRQARKRTRQVARITRDLRAMARQGIGPSALAAYRRHTDTNMRALHEQHVRSRMEPWTPPAPSGVSHANGHSLPTVGRTDGRPSAPPGHPG